MTDMNPERLPTGTLLEDLGCPHCGKTCDVCVTLDEIAADDRHQLRGAVARIAELEADVARLRTELGRWREETIKGGSLSDSGGSRA